MLARLYSPYAVKKSELRQQYLDCRAALSETDFRQKNRQLVERLFTTYAFSFCTVHCFIPSERQREVDTWPIIRRLWTMPGVRVLAPRCKADYTLTHHELTPDTKLANNRWGIPEPTNSLTDLPHAVDLVLVPLLAFDRRGHRVGYGKGFYDRFLQQCRPQTLKVGLSLFSPVAHINDVFSGDVPLDTVIMPGSVWKKKEV